MKKLLTLFALVALAFSVNAQEWCSYGFWSNWSVGIGAQYSKNFTSNWALGEGSNIGFDIRAQKQIAQNWDFRIIANVPGVFTSDTNNFDRYALGMVGFDWSPVQHFYIFADGGIAAKRDRYGWFALAADAGIGTKFNVCDNSTIFGELGIDCVADITTDMTYNNAFVKIGWMYNFGLSKNDKAIAEQKALLAQMKEEENNQNDSLINCLNQCQKNERELIQKIEALENHDYRLTAELGNMSHQNDSLAKVIESIKENQLNYYALPFSILFDNDSYTINDSERGKLKAIASIMKDDTTVHYSVIGFCDQTGSQEYNQKLSERRAETVKKALVRLGVKEEQITIEGNGFDKPFSDGKLAVNRRVSFYRNF